MEVFGITNVGKMRKVNQDSVFFTKEPIGNLPNLFIVADGMGGHKAGDLASKLTVEVITDMVKSLDDKDVVSIINKSVTRANEAVIGKAKETEDYAGMGTTCVVACIDKGILYVANVGDSRLYVINKEITQITRDHSYVEELVSRGQLDRKQARTSEKKNIITRAIGGSKTVMADFFEIKLKKDDVILMCTDGLTNMVEDYEILGIIQQKQSIEQKGNELVDKANANGGKDNIGIILIEA